MKRKLLTLILAGMLSISAIACGSSNSDATEQSESGTDATEESTDAEEEEAAESSEPAIMEQYTQLENGMSYDEVKEVMGADGEEVENENGDANSKVYQWTDKDTDAKIKVTCQDDKAVSFAQEDFE